MRVQCEVLKARRRATSLLRGGGHNAMDVVSTGPEHPRAATRAAMAIRYSLYADMFRWPVTFQTCCSDRCRERTDYSDCWAPAEVSPAACVADFPQPFITVRQSGQCGGRDLRRSPRAPLLEHEKFRSTSHGRGRATALAPAHAPNFRRTEPRLGRPARHLGSDPNRISHCLTLRPIAL